jgi:hypothetical protein
VLKELRIIHAATGSDVLIAEHAEALACRALALRS